MVYPWIYCLRETGTITQGPNAGTVLSGHVQEADADSVGLSCEMNGTLEAARALAAKHRSLEPTMRIEVCCKQYRSRPKRHFHYEVVEVFP